MFTPLEFELRNEKQFKMIKDALTWWVNNFSTIVKKHIYENDIKELKPYANKLLLNMNRASKVPYKLSIKSMKSEQSFVIAISDYLKYNNEIRKPNNKVIFKAVYNVVACAYKDLIARQAMNSVD